MTDIALLFTTKTPGREVHEGFCLGRNPLREPLCPWAFVVPESKGTVFD